MGLSPLPVGWHKRINIIFFERSLDEKGGKFPPHILPILRSSKISPIRAPILFSILICSEENHRKLSVSVRVENTSDYRPVNQNTADLHLTWWLARPLASSCFCLKVYPIWHQQTLPEHEYEGHFFKDADFFNHSSPPRMVCQSGDLRVHFQFIPQYKKQYVTKNQ